MPSRPTGSARLAPKYNVDTMTIQVGIATGTQATDDYKWRLVLELDASDVPEKDMEGKPFLDALLLKSMFTELSARTSEVKGKPEAKAYAMAEVMDLWKDGEFHKAPIKLSAEDKQLASAIVYVKTAKGQPCPIAAAQRTVRGLEHEQKDHLRANFTKDGIFERMEAEKSKDVDLSEYGI